MMPFVRWTANTRTTASARGNSAGRGASSSRTNATVPARIVTFGDSIVNQGGAAAVTSGYSGVGFFPYANEALSNAYAWRTNAGIGGNTTAQMLARMAVDVLIESPDWVLVLGGINDITSDVTPSSTV